MKKSRFTEEQITFALRQADSGAPVADVCRQLVALFFTAALGGREFRFGEVLALTAVMTAFAVGCFALCIETA